MSPLHIFFFGGFLWSLPWWVYTLTFLLVWYGLKEWLTLGVTLYFHRDLAHRSIKLHPAIATFFLIGIRLSGTMRGKNEWAPIHRKHHANVETKDDPHSPRWKPWYKGLKSYIDATADTKSLEPYQISYPKGPIRDWIEEHRFVGVPILLTVLSLLFGLVPGVILSLVQFFWIPLFGTIVINGFGHMIGYRNAETADTSHNLIPWGFFVGGEELHNNHHLYPNSPKFSLKKWEFDMGWAMICVLKKLRLVKVSPMIGRLPIITDAFLPMSEDTVRAFWKFRFIVMKQFVDDLHLHLKNVSRSSEKGVQERIREFRKSIRDGGWFVERPEHEDDAYPYLRTLGKLHNDLARMCKKRVTVDELKAWLNNVSTEGGVTFDRFCRHVASLRLKQSLS